MTYRVAVAWGGFAAGTVASASDLAGCNITMLVARGVLVPVPDQPVKKKRMPVAPVPDDTANEPEEQ